MRRYSFLFLLNIILLLSACTKKIGGDVAFIPDNKGRWWHNLFTVTSSEKAIQGPVLFSGKLTYLKHPVPFADIELYDSRRVFGGFTKPDFYTKTDLLGDFSLKVPGKNAYYLLARKSLKSKGIYLFAFYGDNPIVVDANYTNDVIVPMASILEENNLLANKHTKKIGLYGGVFFNGKPVHGAQVYIYEDSLSGFKKYYTAVSKPTDKEGSFYLKLPRGKYFFIARKRSGSSRVGPLMPGDYYGFYDKNPFSTHPDSVQHIVIQLIKIPDYFNMLANKKKYGSEMSRQRKSLYSFDENTDGNIEQELRLKTTFNGQLLYKDQAVVHGEVSLFTASSNKALVEKKLGADGKFSFPGLLPGAYLLYYKLNDNKPQQPVFQPNGSLLVIIEYGHQNSLHKVSIRN